MTGLGADHCHLFSGRLVERLIFGKSRKPKFVRRDGKTWIPPSTRLSPEWGWRIWKGYESESNPVLVFEWILISVTLANLEGKTKEITIRDLDKSHVPGMNRARRLGFRSFHVFSIKTCASLPLLRQFSYNYPLGVSLVAAYMVSLA